MNTLSPQTGVGWPSVVVPVDGEEIVASSTDPVPAGEGPVTPAFQAMTDQLNYLSLFLASGLCGGVRLGSLFCTGADDTISVGAWGVYFVPGSMDSALIGAATSFSASAKVDGGVLGTDTWYYIYAYLNAGSLDYEVSQTGPVTSLAHKTGAPTYCYIGAFRTGSTSLPRAMTMSRGRYRWHHTSLNSFEPAASLQGGTATTWTDLNLTSQAPPRAKVATLDVLLISASGSAYYTQLRYKGQGASPGTVAGRIFHAGGVAGRVQDSGDIALASDGLRLIQYQNSDANLATTISVVGWEE